MRMKRVVVIVIGILLLLISAAVQSFDPHSFNPHREPGTVAAPIFDARMQHCFSRAMVGMDSVINSRLGVPAGHALALSVREAVNDNQEMIFDEPLLAMILTAYLWEDSPHSYAIKIFYDCAAFVRRVAEQSDFLP